MADPNRLRAATGKFDHGRLYEKKAAKVLSARLRPASGAVVGAKGDMTIGKWLLEAKTTTDASLSLKLGWLVKIAEEAHASGKVPGLIVSFVLPTGRPRPSCESEWCMVPISVFKELTNG